MNRRLTSLSRLSLATLPTPLQLARRLSDALGPQIWFKRDDLTGFGGGGNKVRVLEFLAAEALQHGADTLITGGGAQSNHVRTTMAVAAHLDLDGVAVFHGTAPEEEQGNLLLDRLLGAEIIFTGDPDRTRLDEHIEAEAGRLRRAERQPYVIGRGGASPLGGVGYVAASLELLSQLMEHEVEPDYLFCATGSCCMQAGLLVGAKWLRLPYRLCGITVSRPREECLTRIEELARETAELLGLDLRITSDDIHVCDQHMGPGYGIPTPACLEAIERVAQTEGIFLDPVYTGKAMAGVIDLIQTGRIRADETVVFVHSGGSPALFAKSSAVLS